MASGAAGRCARASVRAVARDTGLSTGSVRHFFHSQVELHRFAMREVIVRARSRVAAGAPEREAEVRSGDPLHAVTDLLEQLLPLDDERLVEARIWAAFSASPADPGLSEIRHEADRAIRRACHDTLVGMVELVLVHPGRHLEVETERLWALLDGITLHLLTETGHTTPTSAREVLRRHLRDLASAPAPE